MIILKQDCTGTIDSKKCTFEADTNAQLLAIPNDGSHAVVIGKFSSDVAARRCISKLFTALSEGNEYFKVPVSKLRKPKEN